MNVAVLITGGKDSALALYRVLKQGYRVKYLVAVFPEREDSWMFHYPNIHITEFFAEAVGIPLVKGRTVGIKEEEVEDLKDLLAGLDIDGVVSGAVASQYQKTRIDKVCEQLDLKSITPLWNEKPENLLRELLENNFEVIIVGVRALGFTQDWLGRSIDEETVQDLLRLHERYGVSPIGEGGEYESLVLDAPCFKKKIQILETEKVWRENQGYLLVKRVKLVPK